jgi:hypothetical protein
MSDALALAAVFTWLGMVLAISFLEAPLKFRAPGVTLALGLGIGRLVFRALNACEIVLAACLIAGAAAGATASTTALVLAIVVAACLLIQVIALQPILDRRAKVIIEGGERTASKGHVAYIGLEVIKLGLLVATGVVLLHGLVS